jgi:hypothetical protein
MFVPSEDRSIPPRWEPPRRPNPDAKRRENTAITLIVLISILALFTPIAGGMLVAVVFALFGH